MTKANGRPTKYKAEYAIQAEKLCKKGFIDSEIADFFCVHVDTIYQWKKVHKGFSESLKRGKRHSDDKVVDALYNRALGYEAKETKEEVGDSGKKTTITTKQIAGDTTAQIFWLKNRQPNDWRDKQEIHQEVTTHNIMPVPVANSADEWEKTAQEQQEKALNIDV